MANFELKYGSYIHLVVAGNTALNAKFLKSTLWIPFKDDTTESMGKDDIYGNIQ